MNDLLISIQFWQYLPVNDLLQYSFCDKTTCQILKKSYTWTYLIQRDFRKSGSGKDTYFKYKSIIDRFFDKILTGTAVDMLFHHFNCDSKIIESFITTHVFKTNTLITVTMLKEIAYEIVYDNRSSYYNKHFGRSFDKIDKFINSYLSSPTSLSFPSFQLRKKENDCEVVKHDKYYRRPSLVYINGKPMTIYIDFDYYKFIWHKCYGSEYTEMREKLLKWEKQICNDLLNSLIL